MDLSGQYIGSQYLHMLIIVLKGGIFLYAIFDKKNERAKAFDIKDIVII